MRRHPTGASLRGQQQTEEPHLEAVGETEGAGAALLTLGEVPAQTAAQTLTRLGEVQRQTVVHVPRGVAQHTRTCGTNTGLQTSTL